ncbi:DUF5675 family protein [Flavobacterium sp.]|uniref:DUF5675 family protein n=1 Tax=Flavobacterium sp. TaxID=239 RepID=UPI00375120C3
MVLKLTRDYFPEGTNGKLESEGIHVCYTIELPWLHNKKRVSCIPEGTYSLRKRHSSKFNWHIELKDVTNRVHILFHPANDALKELKGCIAPVTAFNGIGCGLQSRKAFMKLKSLVYKAIDLEDDVILIVQS